MKQLLFSFFFPFFVFSQSTIIKDSDKIIKTLVSEGSEKVYVFYRDHISSIDLNIKVKSHGILQ